MWKGGGVWESQTEDTVIGGLYKWSECQGDPLVGCGGWGVGVCREGW